MPAPTPDTIALARTRYSEGVAIAKILAETGMSFGTLYLWLDGGPDDGAGPRLPPLRRRRSVMGKRRQPLTGGRVSLVNRLWRTAERQVRDIEDRVRLNMQQPDERERDARLLAILVKTLRDLRALQTVEDEPENDDQPASLDDFRRELARKIDGIVAQRAVGVANSDAGEGT